MKTVKFKDLPEKVQEFLFRISNNMYVYPTITSLEWLHNEVAWSKATDEERLAYSEWKYPEGTYILSAVQTHGIVGKVFEVWRGSVLVDMKDKPASQLCLFSSNTNKWASIISEPEKEDFEMNASIKRDVEQILAEDSEPTFKAGDPVEYYCIAEEKYLPAIYAFKIEGTNWLYTDGNKKDGFNMRCAWSFPDNVLRKPDPDKVYREMAKEIMLNNSLNIEKLCGWNGTTYHEFNAEFLEVVLIEALKKGKEL